jgi:hypothetical protein
MAHAFRAPLSWVRAAALISVTGAGVVVADVRAPAVPPAPYAGAFTDFDLLFTAVAADLKRYRALAGQPVDPVLDSINAVALRIYQKGVVRAPEGRWLFEPGAFDSHPDFRFSGLSDKALVREPKPADNIVEDASHFSQVPLWLNSQRLAQVDRARRAFFIELQAGLCRQFFYAVVVAPTPTVRAFRFNNYMDGRNGLYRMNYLRRGSDWGYGPFELGSTVFNGWWAFLGTDAAAELYDSLSRGFPYSTAEIDAYSGPTPGRQLFTDRRYELLTRLASSVAAGRRPTAEQRREDDGIWHNRFAPQLARQLWTGGNADGAQYTLMIPLHAAFIENRAEWRQEFANHFARFAASSSSSSASSLLGELHYLYFVSRFLVLAEEAGDPSAIPPGLAARLERRIASLWLDAGQTVSQVGWGEPVFRSMAAYETWKVSLPRRYTVKSNNEPAIPGQLPPSCDRPRATAAGSRDEG